MHARYPRRVSRVLLLAALLAVGPASASMVDSSGSSVEGQTDSLPYADLATPLHGHHFAARATTDSATTTDSIIHAVPVRRWTVADARSHVDNDYQGHHHYISGRDDAHHGWHDGNDHGHHCDDDQDPPKPTPLPGAALLFGPALLVLRLIQRRAA